ncbi:heavy metal-responsive transcriptional regulator [Arthrobacter sp. VKM Ac-2550]|uniref:heavy metal-responsive transcriptional regulator n=1 Tax=Crystallibacter permensis TaxID=1938888 RepID=UPI002226D5E1|nr:heavy metal-responsive transcriptional regulator [Arthrobacter sp. VKM Ac-2550]
MTGLQAPHALKVGELAKAVGVSTDALRYYERAGLLPPPDRSPTGYRLYPPSTADRVHFIQGCQRLGLRLAEIADLLDVRDTGRCPCEPAESLLRRRIGELDRELDRLTRLRSDLQAMADQLNGTDCPDPAPGTWCPPGTKSRKEVTLDAHQEGVSLLR